MKPRLDLVTPLWLEARAAAAMSREDRARRWKYRLLVAGALLLIALLACVLGQISWFLQHGVQTVH